MNLNFLRKFFMLILLAAGWAIPVEADYYDPEITVRDGNNSLIATYTNDEDAFYKAIKLTEDTPGDKFTIQLSFFTLNLKKFISFDTGKDITLKLYSSNISLGHGLTVTNGSKLRLLLAVPHLYAEIRVADNAWLQSMFYVEDGSELSVESVDGGNIEFKPTNYVFTIRGKSKLKIAYGNFNSTTNVVYADKGGIIETTGGNFSSSGDLFNLNGGSEMTDNGAIFKSEGNVFVVSGKSKLNIPNGHVLAAKNVVKASDDCDVSISGGYYCTDSGLLPYLASGYRIIRGTDEDHRYWIIPNSENIKAVKFEDNMLTGKYESTIDAINSIVNRPATVRLVNDEYIGMVGGEDIWTQARATLDLNGYTFSKSRGFGIRHYTKLTIIDSSEGKTGKMKSGFVTLEGMFNLDEGVELNFEDGIIESSARLFTNSGTVNISGGKFSYGLFTDGNNKIKINGGYFCKSSNDISINDWEYYINKKDMGSHFVKILSGIEDYPYSVAIFSGYLYYGEDREFAGVVDGNMIIDLKDDKSDYSAWLRAFDPWLNWTTENIDITIKKYFANTNWHAFFAPCKIVVTPELLQDFEFAEIWDTELNPTDNSTSIEFMKLCEGDSILAYTPCLVRTKSTGKKDMVFKGVSLVNYKYSSPQKYWIDCTTVDQKFTFCGVMENTNVNGKYALDSENNALVYVQNADAQVTPFKFYMQVEDRASGTYVQNAKAIMRVIGNDATDIDTIYIDTIAGKPNGKTANSDVYNLQGVKVASSTTGLPAGIYIQNGKKLIVK